MSEHSVWCAHCALQAECISIDREMGLGEEGRKEGRKSLRRRSWLEGEEASREQGIHKSGDIQLWFSRCSA